MKEKRRAVGILGHFGNENLGDEAIIEACLHSAREILKAETVTLFSINPADTSRRYAVSAYPIVYRPPTLPSQSVDPSPSDTPATSAPRMRSLLKRVPGLRRSIQALRMFGRLPSTLLREMRFLRRSATHVAQLDILIIAGSNQFLDNFGGSWGFPYTILKWTCLARFQGIEVAMLSIGAGPLNRWLSRAMIRTAIRLARLHTYRDGGSRRLVEGESADLGGTIVPDLARNLAFNPVRPVALDSERPVVAINPMPVYDHRYWHVADAEKYHSYLNELAQFAALLLKSGHTVKLFPTQHRDSETIKDLLEIIASDCPELAERIHVENPRTVQALMDTISSADVIVPVRFHGTILALQAHRLILSVCYQAKAMEAMEDARVGEFAVMLDEFNAHDLYERFTRLWRERKLHHAAIVETANSAASAVNRQYRTVKELCMDRRSGA